MNVRYQLRCPEGVRMQRLGRSGIHAAGLRQEIYVDPADARLAEVLAALERENISEVEFYALAEARGGLALRETLRACLATLKQVQAISYAVQLDKKSIARILPLEPVIFTDRDVPDASPKRRLHPDIYFQPGRGEVHIHAPGASAEVVVDLPLAAQVMSAACDSAGSRPSVARRLLDEVFADTGHLASGELSAHRRAGWSFADLVFHSSSRLARRWGRFGRNLQAPIAVPGPQSPRPPVIPLTFPLPLMQQMDSPFRMVLAARRSQRRPGLQPLSLGELSSVLWLAAAPRHATHGIGGRYPYPSGGGIYGYRIYVLVHRCLDLLPGVYRYETEDCGLQPIAPPSSQFDSLLAHYGLALTLGDGKPDVMLVITADIEKFGSQYDGIAYRAMLLGAGCIIQNLGLAAATIGLAGCAVGGSRPTLFSEISGADLWREPSVADFALSGGEGR